MDPILFDSDDVLYVTYENGEQVAINAADLGSSRQIINQQNGDQIIVLPDDSASDTVEVENAELPDHASRIIYIQDPDEELQSEIVVGDQEVYEVENNETIRTIYVEESLGQGITTIYIDPNSQGSSQELVVCDQETTNEESQNEAKTVHKPQIGVEEVPVERVDKALPKHIDLTNRVPPKPKNSTVKLQHFYKQSGNHKTGAALPKEMINPKTGVMERSSTSPEIQEAKMSPSDHQPDVQVIEEGTCKLEEESTSRDNSESWMNPTGSREIADPEAQTNPDEKPTTMDLPKDPNFNPVCFFCIVCQEKFELMSSLAVHRQTCSPTQQLSDNSGREMEFKVIDSDVVESTVAGTEIIVEQSALQEQPFTEIIPNPKNTEITSVDNYPFQTCTTKEEQKELEKGRYPIFPEGYVYRPKRSVKKRQHEKRTPKTKPSFVVNIDSDKNQRSLSENENLDSEELDNIIVKQEPLDIEKQVHNSVLSNVPDPESPRDMPNKYRILKTESDLHKALEKARVTPPGYRARPCKKPSASSLGDSNSEQEEKNMEDTSVNDSKQKQERNLKDSSKKNIPSIRMKTSSTKMVKTSSASPTKSNNIDENRKLGKRKRGRPRKCIRDSPVDIDKIEEKVESEEDDADADDANHVREKDASEFSEQELQFDNNDNSDDDTSKDYTPPAKKLHKMSDNNDDSDDDTSVDFTPPARERKKHKVKVAKKKSGVTKKRKRSPVKRKRPLKKRKDLSIEHSSHICDTCGKSFLSSSALNTHIKIHLDLREYKCTLCEKAFIQSGQLKAHIDGTHNRVRRWSCERCSQAYGIKASLKSHMETHLNSDYLIKYEEHVQKNYFHCFICPKKFWHVRLWMNHINEHSAEGNIPEMNSKMLMEILECEQELLLSTQIFPCSVCSSQFLESRRLDMHVKKCHSGPYKYYGKKYKCPHCGKGLETQKRIDAHILTHYYNKTVCHLCNIKFEKMAYLKAHVTMQHETPEDVKDCLCPMCGENTLKELLLDHMRQRHVDHMDKDGNKKLMYICDFCAREFSRKDNMLVHIRIHTKEQPFVCPQCDSRFSDPANRLHHWKRKHADLPLDILRLQRKKERAMMKLNESQ